MPLIIVRQKLQKYFRNFHSMNHSQFAKTGVDEHFLNSIYSILLAWFETLPVQCNKDCRTCALGRRRAFSLRYLIEFIYASEFVSLSRARTSEPIAVRGRLAPEFPVYPNPPSHPDIQEETFCLWKLLDRELQFRRF